jgi:hypothetical protein
MATVSSLKAATTRNAVGSSNPEFVVSAAQILDERMPCGDHSCAAELFEAAHRPQLGLHSAVIVG